MGLAAVRKRCTSGAHTVVATGLAAALFTALTGCGAPAQTEPQPGRPATLSPDVFAYDNPVFLTNRKPVLQPDNECAAITDEMLRQLGIIPPQGGGAKDQSDPAKGYSTPGCTLHDEHYNSLYSIAASKVPFAQYWAATASEKDVPGSMEPGVLSFKRAILKDHYYAVNYLDGTVTSGSASGECATVVDTGAESSLVVTRKAEMQVGNSGPVIPTPDVVQEQCPKTQQVAEMLLDELDNNGGSRVG